MCRSCCFNARQHNTQIRHNQTERPQTRCGPTPPRDALLPDAAQRRPETHCCPTPPRDAPPPRTGPRPAICLQNSQNLKTAPADPDVLAPLLAPPHPLLWPLDLSFREHGPELILIGSTSSNRGFPAVTALLFITRNAERLRSPTRRRVSTSTAATPSSEWPRGSR